VKEEDGVEVRRRKVASTNTKIGMRRKGETFYI